MKLLNDFFTIEGKQEQPGATEYIVRLNGEHIIYKAHFPGQPVTPGVCILQMAMELVEERLQTKLQVVKVKNMKFLSVISPVATPLITCTVSADAPSDEAAPVVCAASVKAGNMVMSKLSFTCIAAHD